MKSKIIFLYLLFFVTSMFSQQKILTPGEAVSIALDNNYGIKLANKNLEAAKNNASVLNSGYLPTITGNAGAVYNVDNTEADFSNGNVTVLNGAESSR